MDEGLEDELYEQEATAPMDYHPSYSSRPDVLTKVERLTKLGEVVQANPDRFDMSYWLELVSPIERTRKTGLASVEELDQIGVDASTDRVLYEGKECGTRACLAGWAVLLWSHELTPFERRDLSIRDAAIHLLDLTYGEASDLFDASAHDNDPAVAAEALAELADIAMSEWTGPLDA